MRWWLLHAHAVHDKITRQVGVLTGSIPALGVVIAGHFSINSRHAHRGSASASWRSRAIPSRRPYLRLSLACAGVSLIGDAHVRLHASHGSGFRHGPSPARALVDAVGIKPTQERAHRSRSTHAAFIELWRLLTAADAFGASLLTGLACRHGALGPPRGLLNETLAQTPSHRRVTRPISPLHSR